jgi:hypothetical protein
MTPSPPRPSRASENEGLVVVSGPHRFRIENGVRVWLSPVPFEAKRDIITSPYPKS